jgi:transposase
MLAGAGGQHQMARPYSQDLRDRVIGSVASGRTCRATAALFGVSVASVVKWSQHWRASGIAAAKPMGGWKQLVLNSEREWLLARIAEKPDLTLRAVVGELAARRRATAQCGASSSAKGSFLKKAYTPVSRTAPMSPAGAPSGRNTRAGLTPSAWCSSTKPGLIPT